MPKPLELLSEHTAFLGGGEKAKFLIEDPLDQDMTFTFSLDTDVARKQSYTRYIVKDPAHGDIIIYNVGDAKTVKVKEPIELGTYRLKYRLFLKYILSLVNTRKYQLQVKFLIQKD